MTTSVPALEQHFTGQPTLYESCRAVAEQLRALPPFALAEVIIDNGGRQFVGNADVWREEAQAVFGPGRIVMLAHLIEGLPVDQWMPRRPFFRGPTICGSDPLVVEHIRSQATLAEFFEAKALQFSSSWKAAAIRRNGVPEGSKMFFGFAEGSLGISYVYLHAGA